MIKKKMFTFIIPIIIFTSAIGMGVALAIMCTFARDEYRMRTVKNAQD